MEKLGRGSNFLNLGSGTSWIIPALVQLWPIGTPLHAAAAGFLQGLDGRMHVLIRPGRHCAFAAQAYRSMIVSLPV